MRQVRFEHYADGGWNPLTGYFHTWGMESIESSNGNSYYSVAIVEGDDGKIYTPVANSVTFITPYKSTTDVTTR